MQTTMFDSKKQTHIARKTRSLEQLRADIAAEIDRLGAAAADTKEELDRAIASAEASVDRLRGADDTNFESAIQHVDLALRSAVDRLDASRRVRAA